MDGEKQTNKNGGDFNMQWQFVRVEDPSVTDTNTYYMYLVHTRATPVNYFLGAAYGEWHVPSGKGDGPFIFLDDDRSCWTTANVIGNTEKLTLVKIKTGLFLKQTK